MARMVPLTLEGVAALAHLLKDYGEAPVVGDRQLLICENLITGLEKMGGIPWNPWNLPELTATAAKRLIESARMLWNHDARIEERSNRPFLVVYDTEKDISYGGDLIRECPYLEPDPLREYA